MAGFQIAIPIAKSTESPNGLKVFGWGSVASDDTGALVVDHHHDVIEPGELEAATYEFVKAARKLDVMHDRDPVGDLIESIYVSPEKVRAMGLGDTARAAWWAGFEIHDAETIARVKSGELAEMSVDIVATRHVLDGDQTAARVAAAKAMHPNDPARPIGRLRDLQINLLSLVDAGAGKGVRVALWKRREEGTKSMTLEQILAKLSPEERAIIAEAMAAKPTPEPPKVEGDETPAAKALRAELDDQRAEFAKQRDEIAKMRADVELRDEIQKVREDKLEHVAGLSLEEIAKTRLALRKHDAGVAATVDKMLRSAAEAHRSALKIHGRSPQVTTTGGAWDAIYEAEKAANPSTPVDEIQKRLARKHPDLYRARNES